MLYATYGRYLTAYYVWVLSNLAGAVMLTHCLIAQGMHIKHGTNGNAPKVALHEG